MERRRYVDGIPLEHFSVFKYLACVLVESGTDEAECSRKVVSERRVAGAIWSLWLMLGVFNLSVLGSCMSHCWFLFLRMVVRMIRREKERSRIRAVQMDTLRVLLGIWRMDKVPNAQLRQFCGVMKGVDKKD